MATSLGRASLVLPCGVRSRLRATTQLPPRRRHRTHASASPATESRTERILQQLEQRAAYNAEGAGGAGAGMTLSALRRVDDGWRRVRNTPEGEAAGPAPQVPPHSPSRPLVFATGFVHPRGVLRFLLREEGS
jgi:hypothetical protein